MSGTPVILGPIVLQDFEIPSRIVWGGEQRLAVHQLIGGRRVIDALGRDDGEITFSGIFSGPDATLRARSIDELRALGGPLPLTWDVFLYTVVIRDFAADYRRRWWIPYRISCTVLRDEAGAVLDDAASLLTSAAFDFGVAADLISPFGLGVGQAWSLLQNQEASIAGTGGYSAAQSELGGLRASVDALIRRQEADFSGEALFTAGDPIVGAAAVNRATEIGGHLGTLNTARSYLSQAALTLASTAR